MKISKLALSLTMLSAWVVTAPVPAACAAGETRIGVVVRFADGTVRTGCAPAGTQASLDGTDALARAGFKAATRSFGSSLGAAVCRIDGYGNSDSDCPGARGHWHYWHMAAGSDEWVESEVGPATHRARPGDIEGWTWTDSTDTPRPPDTTLTQVCSSAALPARPVQRGSIVFPALGLSLIGAGAIALIRRRRDEAETS